ncbi:chemotaxis protein CheW [Desulfonema ishimotonii]|nr:chemotaxis protein CheW [Desulfonema ishimotonii]
MLFQAGGRRFGLALSVIRSVHRGAGPSGNREQITVSGDAICLPDGREIPLYNLSAILGETLPDDRAAIPRIICLKVRATALAIGVDSIERVIETAGTKIVCLPPLFTGKSATWFPHVLKHEGRLILLLDPEGMAGMGPPCESPEPEDIIDLTEAVPSDNEALIKALERLLPGKQVEGIMMKALERGLTRSARHGMAKVRQVFSHQRGIGYRGENKPDAAR